MILALSLELARSLRGSWGFLGERRGHWRQQEVQFYVFGL